MRRPLKRKQLCSVIAYYTSKSLKGTSLYSENLKRKAAAAPDPTIGEGRVADMMRPNPPTLSANAHFAEIARMFLNVRVNNLYVVDAEGKYIGVVALHDIKPYLAEPDLAELVIARDILRDDFPTVAPDQPLTEALAGFLGVTAERLPVVDRDLLLRGSLAKSDLLLALVEKRKSPQGLPEMAVAGSVRTTSPEFGDTGSAATSEVKPR